MEDLKIYAAIIGSGILTIITIVIIIKTIYGWIKNLFKPPDRPWETKEYLEKRKEKYKREQEASKYFKQYIAMRTKNESSTYSGYPDNWNDIKLQVRRRDGNKCGNCGSTTNLHVHHIVPILKGGTSNLSNLRTLCRDCHKKLHPHMR